MANWNNAREVIESERFRKRPGMYFGSNSILHFRSFYDGMIEFSESDPLRGFNEWVAEHYNWPESTVGWANIILKECGGDEDNALKTFFELYDAFKNKSKAL